jgi:excinuclease UvrABC nuclease subunit
MKVKIKEILERCPAYDTMDEQEYNDLVNELERVFQASIDTALSELSQKAEDDFLGEPYCNINDEDCESCQ